jgi:hypothetical protein
MGTHDEIDKSGFQKEISSDFKSGPVSQGIGAQRYSDISAQDNKSDVSSKAPTAGLWHRKESNPYRLTQTSEKGVQSQQYKAESFESSTRSGFIQQIKEKFCSREPGEGSAKQKAMIFLVPILAIVFIFVLRQVFTKAPTKTDARTNDNMPVVITANNSDDIDWQIPEPLPVVMRDPAKTGSHANFDNIEQNSGETQLGDMTVRGILYSYDKPSVVIGGKIVHLNEKINDVTVVAINKDYVVFEKDGKRWTRKVAESEPIQEENFQEEPEQEELEENIKDENSSISEL